MSIQVQTLVDRLDRRCLSPSRRAVLRALADYGNDEGANIFPGKRGIANKTGYDKRTVDRAVNALESRGAIVVERSRGGTPGTGSTNRYWISVDWLRANMDDRWRLAPSPVSSRPPRDGAVPAESSINHPSSHSLTRASERVREIELLLEADAGAVVLWAAAVGREPRLGEEERIRWVVKDPAKWAEVLVEWIGGGWHWSLPLVLDRYSKACRIYDALRDGERGPPPPAIASSGQAKRRGEYFCGHCGLVTGDVVRIRQNLFLCSECRRSHDQPPALRGILAGYLDG